MNTLVCVPIQVDDIDAALADANQAKLLGADIVELRIDSYFPGSEGDEEDAFRLEQLRGLLADCPLPIILTCRSAEEGGDYDGDEADRVSMLEKLCVNTEHPPAYLDFELASYQKSANIRQKINLCVDHPKQEREVRTRLILSMHDFDGRPADLMRRLADAWSEPAAAVVKFAFRARSIRDNLEIFEILRDAPKPTIGLGMGEFGLMSRVLAPKFGGFLTFAALRDEATTAPGQPSMADLLGMYRFRSIGKDTKLYGVIGWPVSQSMSPLIHNAGFEARGVDAVYLPMPVAADDDPEVSYTSFKTSILAIWDSQHLHAAGGSVTLPHKRNLVRLCEEWQGHIDDASAMSGAANTIYPDINYSIGTQEGGVVGPSCSNSDSAAIRACLIENIPLLSGKSAAIFGTGGVARAAIGGLATHHMKLMLFSRKRENAEHVIEAITDRLADRDCRFRLNCQLGERSKLTDQPSDIYINCTPVGMTGGPDPDGLSIPIHEIAGKLPPETVFFDTVYNPIETPMLKAAKSYGFRTIDGVEMFVKQAAAQFELWTGEQAPIQLFDRLVRERLAED